MKGERGEDEGGKRGRGERDISGTKTTKKSKFSGIQEYWLFVFREQKG